MWTPPPDDPIVVHTNEDALDFALGATLFRPFDRLLALADTDGRIRVVIVDPTDGLLDQCGTIGLPAAVLVTTALSVAGPLREDDIAAFRESHRALGGQGVRLIDWIHMAPDGELFRSMVTSIDAGGEAA